MSRAVNWDNPTIEDFNWLVEWERWHDLQAHGYDVAEIQRRYGLGDQPDGHNFFNTGGVPGSDFEMRINPKSGLPETVRKIREEEAAQLALGGGEDPDDPDGPKDNEGDSDSEGDEGDELPDDYNDWKLTELKDELANRGLATSGNKPELVRRLEISDAGTQG